jgi:hypothetical protein
LLIGMNRQIFEEPSECLARVEKCSTKNCAYNSSNQCHANAITVGEGMMTKCDTYLPSLLHVDEKTRVAHVGACKVSTCAYNEDFECRAKQVRMGQVNGQPGCLEFASRFPW